MIDDKKLLNEINNIQKNFYRVKSYTDYLVLYEKISHLSILYRQLTGIELDIIIPNINNYYLKIDERKFNSDESLEQYYFNQKEHNKLSGKVLGTFNRSGINFSILDRDTSKISLAKQIELINAFLYDLNPKMQVLFNNMLKNNLIDNSPVGLPEGLGGVTFFDYETKEYILLKNSNRIKFVDYLMHELGHAYSYKMLENKSRKQQFSFGDTFFEMPSTFMELCFQDFLKRNHVYEEDRLKLQIDYFYKMHFFFFFLKNCKYVTLLDSDNIRRMHYSYIYSYGYYLSMLIHEDKLKDKESTLERLDDYLSYQGLLDRDEQLKIFGLDRDKLKDMKVLKKRLESHNNDVDAYLIRNRN